MNRGRGMVGGRGVGRDGGGIGHKFKHFSRSFGPRDTVMACNEASSTTVYRRYMRERIEGEGGQEKERWAETNERADVYLGRG